MSIIGDIVGTVAKAVLPAVIDSVFPPAALFPGLTNMVSNMVGDELGKAIDGCLKQSGTPGFQIKDILNLLKQVVGGMQHPCDPACSDHVKDKFGGIAQHMVDDLIKNFKDAFQQYQNENCGKGGKGGKGGSAGTAGPVGFRELAAILAQLEQKEAQNVKDKVQKASDALGVAKQAGTDQSNNDANAKIEQDQFKAMEESKAEAQIFQTLSSAISEVMKNFGGALQTAARGG